MKQITVAVLAILVGTSGSCRNSTGPTVVPNFYVDAVHGNDANAGTSDAPFKTITHALSVAAAGNTIKVRPGRYDDANGERFPLAGPIGVILIGDEANKGGGATPTTVVSNSIGLTLLSPPANAVIAGFTIIDSVSRSLAAVTIAADSVTLRNDQVVFSLVEGVEAYGTGYLIAQSVFTGNRILGLRVGGSGKIEDNVIRGNGGGVLVLSPTADMGGGAVGSVGVNILSCNTDNDLVTYIGGTITAEHDRWDHLPPTIGNGVGPDIDNAGDSTTVLTTGATLAPGACP